MILKITTLYLCYDLLWRSRVVSVNFWSQPMFFVMIPMDGVQAQTVAQFFPRWPDVMCELQTGSFWSALIIIIIIMIIIQMYRRNHAGYLMAASYWGKRKTMVFCIHGKRCARLRSSRHEQKNGAIQPVDRSFDHLHPPNASSGPSDSSHAKSCTFELPFVRRIQSQVMTIIYIYCIYIYIVYIYI